MGAATAKTVVVGIRRHRVVHRSPLPEAAVQPEQIRVRVAARPQPRVERQQVPAVRLPVAAVLPQQAVPVPGRRLAQ